MKKLVLLIMLMVMLTGCNAAFQEEEETSPYGESGSFEDFVDSEMIFDTVMEVPGPYDGPDLLVETDGGYVFGRANDSMEGEGGVIVNDDDHYTYLADLMIIDSTEKDEHTGSMEPGSDGSFLIEEDEYVVKLIPLSDDYYCEVYVEDPADIDLLDHLTITVTEKNVESGGERRQRAPVISSDD